MPTTSISRARCGPGWSTWPPTPEIDVVYGEGYWIDDKGDIIRRYPTLPFDSKVLERDCFICQPAAFIRASSYKGCGLDPDVARSFDYDLWIRMAKQNLRFALDSGIPGGIADAQRGEDPLRAR